MDSSWNVGAEDRTNTDWMQALATKFAAAIRHYPDDELMIVFDIDGTILNMRYMVSHVLIDYDRSHGTDHFAGLGPEDVTEHVNHIDQFLGKRGGIRTIYFYYSDPESSIC